MSERLAVITGASSGIGFELARVFAAEGFDLLIAAEDAELGTALEELHEAGANVEAHRVNLATEAGVIEFYGHIQNTGRPVAALALNAGIGAAGAFATETMADELKLIDLNVRGTVQLSRLAIREMVERDDGRILFTSSIAATMPGPFQVINNASKSFVQSFALALRNELKDTGVSVTSLMPGEKDDPAEVARQGFDALMAGKKKVVAGEMAEPGSANEED